MQARRLKAPSSFGCLALLGVAGAAQQGQGNDLLADIPPSPFEVRLEFVASVFPDPAIDITFAPDGSGRLFIVAPNGVVRILKDGALLSTPFLNLPASPPERAMSALAFHPDYATNGKLYVISGEALPTAGIPHYSSPQDDTSSAFDNVLFELTVDASNPDVVDSASIRELLRVHQPHRLHNVNDLAFGGDGTLFIAVGDGGDTRTGTPIPYQSNAQSLDNPFGSVLRIDVDSLGTNGRYAIPPTNPFPSGAVPELASFGFRNPWRISTDRLTGELYVADNGDFTIESIVRLQLGKNYGWPILEGGFLWDPITGNATVDPSPDPAYTPPTGRYDHRGSQAYGSIIGGSVYRGAQLPELYGMYIGLDWLAARFIAMDPESGALELLRVDVGGAQLQPTLDITMGEDEAGELYVGRTNGAIFKLVRARPAQDRAGVPAGPIDRSLDDRVR